MAEKTTFIKLDRNILKWRWYQDANTMRVFLHLLLTANIKQADFKKDKIKRGQLATSIGSIASHTGMTYDQARTALEHLKQTNEITTTARPKYLVITVVNYDKYQDKPMQNPAKSQTSPKHVPSTSQRSKKYKKDINIQERENPVSVPLSVGDVSSFVQNEKLDVDPDAFWNYYQAIGWIVGGKSVRDWKALCRTWNGKPNYAKHNEKRQEELDDVTRRWLEQ